MSRLILIPHLGSGGAERVAVNLFRALGFEGVITFENRVAYDLPSEKVECIESPASDSLTKKFLNFPVRFWKIRAIKKKFGSRLTLSFLEPANLFNVLTKSSTERVVLSFRGHYSNDISHSPFWGRGITKYLVVFLYKIAFRLFYNRADLMVAVSHSARKDLVENFHLDPRKIEVIYNPVFLDEVVSRSGEGLGEHEILFKFPTLITAGRLTKAKGQWYLLRVFRELKRFFGELKLLILGEGELRDYLVRLSFELGLRSYVWDRDDLSEEYDVYFLGFQSNPFKYLANSTLFVFPSLWEGFPNALLEALACGVPVVSSDCRSGPREILSPLTDFDYQTSVPEFAEYGVLMPPFEAKFKGADEPLDEVERMWVDVIAKLLRDEALRREYSLKGKERAKEFDIKVIAQKWKKVLEGCL